MQIDERLVVSPYILEQEPNQMLHLDVVPALIEQEMGLNLTYSRCLKWCIVEKNSFFLFLASFLFFIFLSSLFLHCKRETLCFFVWSYKKKETAIDHEAEQDPLWFIHICSERYCDTPVWNP